MNERKMTVEQVSIMRGMPDDFMSFWEKLNAELATRSSPQALWGDAHDLFTQWAPQPTATQAADHIMLLRGER